MKNKNNKIQNKPKCPDLDLLYKKQEQQTERSFKNKKQMDRTRPENVKLRKPIAHSGKAKDISFVHQINGYNIFSYRCT